MATRPKRSVRARFWQKVDRSGGPSACWPYVGALNADKYGVFRVDNNGTGLVYAHRFAWADKNGPIPEGVEIMHTCPTVPRLRSCCNDAHLAPGTHQENCAPGERANGKRWGGGASALSPDT